MVSVTIIERIAIGSSASVSPRPGGRSRAAPYWLAELARGMRRWADDLNGFVGALILEFGMAGRSRSKRCYLTPSGRMYVYAIRETSDEEPPPKSRRYKKRRPAPPCAGFRHRDRRRCSLSA